MAGAESSIVIFPRFTTLVAHSYSVLDPVEFTSLPLDVSGYGAVQLQVWRGEMIYGDVGSRYCELFLEESLDAAEWSLGPYAPEAIPLYEKKTLYLSYSFRLRWFRLRVRLIETRAVTLWAEGLLR
jgi:hypothetical protein